jgi:hypothetical protein
MKAGGGGGGADIAVAVKLVWRHGTNGAVTGWSCVQGKLLDRLYVSLMLAPTHP